MGAFWATVTAILLMTILVAPATYFEHFHGRTFWEGIDHLIHGDPIEEDREVEVQATRELEPRATLSQDEMEEGEEELQLPLGERVNEWIREYLPWW